jgi:hypothetical protein
MFPGTHANKEQGQEQQGETLLFMCVCVHDYFVTCTSHVLCNNYNMHKYSFSSSTAGKRQRQPTAKAQELGSAKRVDVGGGAKAKDEATDDMQAEGKSPPRIVLK